MNDFSNNGFNKQKRSEIQEFYKGKCVFVTGGTGFVGSVVIEKLLRSCPEIDSIYLMTRNKRGKSVEERKNELLDGKIFSTLDKRQKSLVHTVTGELGLPGLGLSMEDALLLKSRVHIVIHCGAIVKFSEKLRLALKVNVKGSLEVIKLSKNMPNLISFVYVSTAFSHSNKISIQEVVQPPSIDLDLALALAELDDDYIFRILEPKIIGDWPNNYTFTKALAENIIKAKGHGLPITIFRPAIVTSTSYQAEIQGYSEHVNGLMALIAGVHVGIIRISFLEEKKNPFIVPADLCANGIIVSAWYGAKERPVEPIVFNFVEDKENYWPMEKMCKASLPISREYPSEHTMWYPDCTITGNKLIYLKDKYLLHILPAILMDLFLILTWKTPKVLRIYSKLEVLSKFLFPFANIRFEFGEENIKALIDSMSQDDREIFNFDMKTFDWGKNMKSAITGIHKFVLNQSMDVTGANKNKLFRFKILHYVIKIMYYFFLSYLIWKLFNRCHQYVM